MMSVELLLDGHTDALIREQWATLMTAGLPSQGRHTGASNAPHVTLVAADTIDPQLSPGPDGAGILPPRMPLPVSLGGWIVFGAPPRGLVLARAIVVSEDLLELHRCVVDATVREGTSAFSLPGQWSPHITVASRLTPAQLAEAIDLLAGIRSPDPALGTDAAISAVTADALRHWNGSTKTITPLFPA